MSDLISIFEYFLLPALILTSPLLIGLVILIYAVGVVAPDPDSSDTSESSESLEKPHEV